jgi:hypothetical protein
MTVANVLQHLARAVTLQRAAITRGCHYGSDNLFCLSVEYGVSVLWVGDGQGLKVKLVPSTYLPRLPKVVANEPIKTKTAHSQRQAT